MPLRIMCPTCKASFAVDNEFRGKQITCRECKKPLMIPPASAPSPSSTMQSSVMTPAKPVPASTHPVASNRSSGPHDKSTQRGMPLGLVLILSGGVIALSAILFVAAAILTWNTLSPSNPQGSSPISQVAQIPTQPPTKAGDETPNQVNDKNEKPVVQPPPPIEPKPIPVHPKPPPEPQLPIGGQLNKDVLDKVKLATVYVRVTAADDRVIEGSGFFGIEPGLVLTNAHVLGMLEVESLPPKQVELVYKSGEPDSRTFTGRLIGVDRSSDLAFLRVSEGGLPPPLDVKSTSDLMETQSVYVVGFPFGSTLGKNVTVSQSSVSSLRKTASGEVVKVQVNGGMVPGNSGGPVVNAAGEVVGVAVSVIQATPINFAVPAEFIHHVLSGRITNIRNGATIRDGSTLHLPVTIDLLDPLARVKKVTCEWWTASPGKPRPPSDVAPTPEPGDSARQKLLVDCKDGQGLVQIALPNKLPPSHIVWVQPVIVNSLGQTKWSQAVSIIPPSPVERVPALIALKHYWGARPLKFTNRTQMRLSKSGIADLEISIAVNATMTETMISQQKKDAALRLRYTNYEVDSPPQEGMPPIGMLGRRLKPFLNMLHADLIVDERNNLKKNTLDFSKAPRELREDLTDLHAQIQEALEMLTVPLPGKTMKPGDTWKSKRALMIFSGDRGDPARMEVIYTFEGVRETDRGPEAVITINGLAADQVDGFLSASGRVTGLAYLDLTAFQIAVAEVDAELSLKDELGKKMIVSLKSKMERMLGKELLKVEAQLTAKDPRDSKGRPYKAYQVKLKAGKPCVFSLESPVGPAQFDTVLRIEDSLGKLVEEDEDNGVDRNSLIVFTPPNDGTYRIITTCAQPAMGSYLLVVRQ